MQYPDVKNSDKEKEDHWTGLSDLERERFERHGLPHRPGIHDRRSAHLSGQDRLENAKLPAAPGTRLRALALLVRVRP
jgi:hypothetical protein